MIDGEYVSCDDPVVVNFRDGIPDTLVWEGLRYRVQDVPQEWVYHEPWWTGTTGQVDVVVWRLRLRPLPGQRVSRARDVDVKPTVDGWRLFGELMPS